VALARFYDFVLSIDKNPGSAKMKTVSSPLLPIKIYSVLPGSDTWPYLTVRHSYKIVTRVNKDAALDLIRKASEGISRAEIAQALNISRATASSIVDRLIASGLVLERGAGVSRGGRRPIVLEVNPSAGQVIGVDIGASHVVVVITDLRGKILSESEEPFDITRGPEACLNRVADLVESLVRKSGCTWAEVRAVGMGVPGPVIIAEGIVSSPPIMPGWDGFPIRTRLEDRWHKPVMIDNDADLGVLGEWTFGAGRGESNLAYIKIGTGIGCGILLNGEVYHGVLGTAGEIGHFTISQDGPPCKCGNYGCLEAMAGGQAIAQRAQLAVKAGQRTSLAALDGEITAQAVAQAAQTGDLVSQQLLRDAGRHIGSALASLVNLLNPGLVLIGGGVAQAGAPLLDPIRESARQRCLRAAAQAARIEVAALKRYSVVMGAVALALSHAFESHAQTKRRRERAPA
jgi:glucokinase-like ROK family protein